MTLPDYSELSVLVIGDVMLDEYIAGTSNRISSEAGVPIMEVKETWYGLGGAANVALNIKVLGAKVFLMGLIGEDINSKKIKKLLTEHKISNDLLVDKSRKTTTKTRVIAGDDHILRMDTEDIHDIGNDRLSMFLERIIQVVENHSFNLLILQDYEKGLFTDVSIPKILKIAQDYGIPVAVDPKEKNFFLYKNLKLFKPNLRELETALNKRINPTEPELYESIKSLSAKIHTDYVVVSLSEYGMYYYSSALSGFIPAKKRNIADVCGAGDTVMCLASLSLTAGISLKKSSEIANLGGGIVCEVKGVSPIDVNKLKEELLSHKEDN